MTPPIICKHTTYIIMALLIYQTVHYLGMLKDYQGNIISMDESETILDSAGGVKCPKYFFYLVFWELSQMNTGFEYQVYIVIRNLDYTAGWEFLPLPDGTWI